MRLWFRTPARKSLPGQPLPTPAKAARSPRAVLRLEACEDRTATSAVAAGPEPDWDGPPALVGDAQPAVPADSPKLPKPAADLETDAVGGKSLDGGSPPGLMTGQVPPAIQSVVGPSRSFGGRFGAEMDQADGPAPRPEKTPQSKQSETTTTAGRSETESTASNPASPDRTSNRADRSSHPADKANGTAAAAAAAATNGATTTTVPRAVKSIATASRVRSAAADAFAAPAKGAVAPAAAAAITAAAQASSFPADLTDGTLLQRFVADREQAAFAALVQRHGGFVLGVCHRVLGDFHAAQDAVQATFLVLARKAGMLDRSGPLGGWLYKVAYHLALRSRGVAARQKQTERAADPADTTEAPAPEFDLELEEVREALREELQSLPEKYRAPLMLCYFDGRTHADAAREIGVPRGSMAKRIGEGLECLRERLLDRGLTF